MAKKLTDGSSITDLSVGTWNDMVDAAEDFKRRRLGLVPAPTIPNPEGFIKVQNNGSTLEGGEAVEVGDYLLAEPDRLHLWLDGNVPEDDQRDHYAVVPVTSKAETISWAMLLGVGIFHVNKLSEYHRYVKLSPGGGLSMFPPSYFAPEYFPTGYFGSGESDHPKLYSDWFGCGEIIKWLEEGDTGFLKAIVRLTSRTWPTYLAKTIAAVDEDAFDSVSVWMGPHGSEEDTEATIDNVLSRGGSIDADSFVYVSWVGGPENGGPEMMLVKCPPAE